MTESTNVYSKNIFLTAELNKKTGLFICKSSFIMVISNISEYKF